MPIPVLCSCGKNLNIPDQYAGMKVKCPACSTTINVPAAGPAAPPPPPSRQTSKPAPSASEEESPEDGRYTLDEFLECFPSVTREMACRLLARSESAVPAACES